MAMLRAGPALADAPRVKMGFGLRALAANRFGENTNFRLPSQRVSCGNSTLARNQPDCPNRANTLLPTFGVTSPNQPPVSPTTHSAQAISTDFLFLMMPLNQNDTEPKTYPWRIPPQADEPAPQPGTPAPEEENDRIPWRKLLKYLLIGLVGMFLLLVLFDKIIMPWYVKLGDVETVPNVVGLPFDSAKVKLEERGFEVRKGESRNDDKYPAGAVAQQLPYGGAETKHGRRVYLTISLGTEMIAMPNMVGMQVREARITLMRAGLDIGEITYEYNDTVIRDLIFSQSIPPQVGARPGSLINVVVSRGPTTRYTLMPSLVSLDVEQARTRLENAGLVLGVVRYKEDGGWAPNIVLEQSVAPYAKVAERAAIDVVVAAAPGSMGPTPQGDEASQPDEPTVKNVDEGEKKPTNEKKPATEKKKN